MTRSKLKLVRDNNTKYDVTINCVISASANTKETQTRIAEIISSTFEHYIPDHLDAVLVSGEVLVRASDSNKS